MSGDVTVFASLWVDSQEATVVPFAVLGLPDCSLSVFAAGFFVFSFHSWTFSDCYEKRIKKYNLSIIFGAF